jgi:hypothetical protein
MWDMDWLSDDHLCVLVTDELFMIHSRTLIVIPLYVHSMYLCCDGGYLLTHTGSYL